MFLVTKASVLKCGGTFLTEDGPQIVVYLIVNGFVNLYTLNQVPEDPEHYTMCYNHGVTLTEAELLRLAKAVTVDAFQN